MKRILCIISSLNAGGAETFLMKVARVANPDEYQLDFVVSEEGGIYTDEVLSRGGRIFYVPTRHESLIKALCGIKKIVKENNYSNVLKLGNRPNSVLDLVAAKLGGASNLAMRSCNALTGLSKIQKCEDAIFRVLLNRITNLKLAPSELAAIYTFGRKQVVKGNTTIIHNAVDCSVFHYIEEDREKVRQSLKIPLNALVVGHVGRFSKQKNHEFLLRTFKEILNRHDTAFLLLVGEGELETKIRKLAAELNIENRIVFAGLRRDIPAILSSMDVFVFPSYYEGMPNTVIEAQATGLPCLISDSITSEANITGLVKYLPLTLDASMWAEKVDSLIQQKRESTREQFVQSGYEINAVSRKFFNMFL